MATIDDKVVAMSFESSKFESGVNKSLTSLDKLKAALKFPHSGKAIAEIGAASKAVDLGHIAKDADSVAQRLTKMGIVSAAVFVEIAQKAISTGVAVAKAFTIDPAKAGFAEYTTNLNAVQTILANTQASGATLKDVNAALDELNTYSDKTIYNFSQMARNIGTFTAAGVDLKTATASIKGIANLAALSGSNAEQASTAMYQLSQAISSGSVKLMDWNSVVNAGMGGTVFQRALAQTAEHMGKLKKGTVELVGPMKNVKIAGESFRNSLSAPGKDGWLSSGVLTETLKMFTSDMTDAELKAKGWNAAEIKAIQAQAKTAMLAATNVKTLSQVLQVAKETAGSGWAKTWQIVFGDFGEAKKTFTQLSNTINGFIIDSARARNNVLADWKALGGRTLLIDSIRVAFHNLGAAIKPIKEAFRDIFPPITGKNLMALTVQFAHFAEALKPGKQTIDNLKQTFKGLFSVLDIVKEVIFGVVGVIGDLLGSVGKGRGDFLEFTANMGNALTYFHQWLIEGGRLAKFFDGLSKILQAPIQIISRLIGAWKTMISSFIDGFGGFGDGVDGVSSSLSGFSKVLEIVGKLFNKFLDGISGFGDLMAPVAESIGKGIASIGVAIGQAASGMNFDAILQVIRTGLLGGIFLMFKNFLGKGAGIDQLTKGFAGIGGGILQNISGSFKALQGNLVAMQQNIKADTLKKIAIAVALLAGSMVAMSLVDPSRLKTSLAAMTVAFGELLGAMAVLTAVSKTAGFIKMPLIASSLILLAGAIVILSAAVVIMAQLSWGELIRGLTGVAGLLAALVLAVGPLSANSSGMIRAGIGITALAIGLRIMASAVIAMSELSLPELAKGLGAVAVSLGILVTATNKMPSGGMIGIGIGLMAVAVALRIMAEAVEAFGAMDLRTMGKGLLGIGGSLVVIGLAMKLMPGNMLLTGAGLVLVSVALQLIAKAVESMGGMSIREIAKGLIALGGAMLILAAGMHLMSGAVGGALALAVVSASLALLVPVLIKLGSQSWGTIIKSMIALAAGIALLAGASILLSEAIPFMIGLGIALTLIGAGVALVGAGLFLISAAISALVVSLPTGMGILIAALIELQEAIPRIVKNTILGLLEIVDMVAEVAPKFVAAIVDIVGQLVNVVIQVAPKLAVAFGALLDMALGVIRDKGPDVIQAGLGLLLDLIQGLTNNVGQLVTATVGLIGAFLRAIGNKIGDIVKAGGTILLAVIKGILGGIGFIVTTVVSIIAKFVSTIASNLGKIATAGLSILTRFLQAIANNLGKVITAGTNIIVNFVTGIGNALGRIVTAAVKTVVKFCATLGQQAQPLANAALKLIIDLLNGLTAAINANSEAFGHAAAKLGIAMVAGLAGAIRAGVGDIKDALLSLLPGPLKKFAGKLGITSPSKVFYQFGEYMIQGLALGIAGTDDANKAIESTANGVITTLNDIFETASPSKVTYRIGQFVGQGFAEGLTKSADDIKNSFATMKQRLKDDIVSTREDIASEQDRLAEMLDKKQEKLNEINDKKWKKAGEKAKAIAEVQKEYAKSIKESENAIKSSEATLATLTVTQKTLNKDLQDEKSKLIGLANDLDKVNERLKEANAELERIKQQRDDFAKEQGDKYAAPPEISEPLTKEIKGAREKIAAEQKKLDELLGAGTQDLEKIASARASLAEAQGGLDELVKGKVLTGDGSSVDVVKTYLQDLNNQQLAVAAYGKTLAQLRTMGLDEKTYRMLVEDGVASQGFAEALLRGGLTAVKGVNKLDEDIKTEADKLAVNSAAYLYAAGIKAAEDMVTGLTNGIKSEKGKIQLTKEVNALARLIIATMKKALKQKSPSKVFEEIGIGTMEGLALGFENSSKRVTKAVDGVAQNAISAMQSSLSKISSAVNDELNPNPVITPILDLTEVRAQGAELAALTGVTPITAAASYGQASLISAQQTAAQADESVGAPVGPSVMFEQNNYSPEALSDIEIYRQTKNQLSQLKSVLAIT